MKKKNKRMIALIVLFFISLLPVLFLDLNTIFYGSGNRIRGIITTPLLIGLLAVWAVSFLVLYIRHDKDYSVTYKEAYYEKPPYDYSPSIACFLMTYGKLDFYALIADFANIWHKGYVYISEDKKGSIIIGRTESYDSSQILRHEQFLIEWLLGKDDCLGVYGKFESIAEDKQKAELFVEKYEHWINLVREQSEEYNFFVNNKTVKRIGKVLGSIYALAGILLAYAFDRPSYFLFFVLGVVLNIYSKGLSNRTKSGQEHYEKWMAFKRYVNAFSRLDSSAADKSQSVDLKQWQNNISYSIAFKSYEGVLKEINSLTDTKNPADYSDIYNLKIIEYVDKSVDVFKNILRKAIL